ncbi:hypothetical protein [Maribellus maritimus]|uniref:hypothetical protein n=1 Tax=Maribellus maritimus TaxID=2870838 RepID=UPI001EEA947E|nr:hypothetical protein [Maribellus maritimus]MCG6186213.1 hypothetical protein [Maribellus maritimus]
MKPSPFVTIVLSFCFLFSSTQAQEKWITDAETQFKIKIPETFTQKQTRDGTDKVFTLMSPDENVFIRVRALKAESQLTSDLLQKVFEQNMIRGAQRIMNKDGDLHGIPARASAYTWKIDESDAILAVYYIIQNGFAYVVWAAVPENLAHEYSDTADGIIDSFELLSTPSSNAFAGLSSAEKSSRVTLLDCKMGTQVDQNYRVLFYSTNFTTGCEKIYIGFSYSGNAFSNPLLVKWYSRSLQQLMNESSLNTPNENGGHGNAFITNNGAPWLKGDYYVEIWHDGKMLNSQDFIIR